MLALFSFLTILPLFDQFSYLSGMEDRLSRVHFLLFVYHLLFQLPVQAFRVDHALIDFFLLVVILQLLLDPGLAPLLLLFLLCLLLFQPLQLKHLVSPQTLSHRFVLIRKHVVLFLLLILFLLISVH